MKRALRNLRGALRARLSNERPWRMVVELACDQIVGAEVANPRKSLRDAYLSRSVSFEQGDQIWFFGKQARRLWRGRGAYGPRFPWLRWPGTYVHLVVKDIRPAVDEALRPWAPGDPTRGATPRQRIAYEACRRRARWGLIFARAGGLDDVRYLAGWRYFAGLELRSSPEPARLFSAAMRLEALAQEKLSRKFSP